jgi:hypothetical protein
MSRRRRCLVIITGCRWEVNFEWDMFDFNIPWAHHLLVDMQEERKVIYTGLACLCTECLFNNLTFVD